MTLTEEAFLARIRSKPRGRADTSSWPVFWPVLLVVGVVSGIRGTIKAFRRGW